MKVTCISNDPKELSDHQQSRFVVFEGNHSLTIGKAYPVVGMMISERAFYFLIRDDWGGPCFTHAGFFELFTAPIPENWHFGLKAGIYSSGKELWAKPIVAIWGYLELIENPTHMQDLFELEPAALAVFDAYMCSAESAESFSSRGPNSAF